MILLNSYLKETVVGAGNDSEKETRLGRKLGARAAAKDCVALHDIESKKMRMATSIGVPVGMESSSETPSAAKSCGSAHVSGGRGESL